MQLPIIFAVWHWLREKMNSNLGDYLERVKAANSRALVQGKISLSEALPCTVCRELEVPSSRFVDSSDPFLMSYRALRRIQRLIRPVIPRKIEFGSAVYLKEGVIDCIFPNSPVTLIFIGDGNSDKRFAYNSYRLFSTFRQPFRVHGFILNPDLINKVTTFGREPVKPGWDDRKLFFHAQSWSELKGLTELIEHREPDRQVILVIDLDGTLLCPRPVHAGKIREVRKKAIANFCDNEFDDSFFGMKSTDQVSRLEHSYNLASDTGFSRSFDDEDLTMLIALGLYAGIIEKNDDLLNPSNNIGFVTPIEWLQYASFLIENNLDNEYRLRQLRALYVRCADAIQTGAPTAFLDFRKEEEKVLIRGAEQGEIVLNRALIEFIRDSADRQAVPIGFSDRPNASLGLETTSSPACTASAGGDAMFNTPLNLVAV
jgi:hypothetical protein